MGFFRNLFRPQPKLEPIDLSILNTDVHSHLIPGIDDGSKSMEETLNMLRKFEKLGYKKVITTPHIMSDFYRNDSKIILNGLQEVRNALPGSGISIEIEAAAEYYLDHHFLELIAQKDLLTFGQNHVLFELSFTQEQKGLNEAIFNLQTEGFKPILAHVERYPYYNNDWKKLEQIRDRGVLFQLNINSLSGQYGPQVKRMAEQLIDRGWIHLIGSDCHHIRHLEGIEALRTNPYLHQIVEREDLLNRVL